jgi:hypothetical protein
MIAVPSFDCCPHMARLRESLEHADLERVRLEIETAQLQQERGIGCGHRIRTRRQES